MSNDRDTLAQFIFDVRYGDSNTDLADRILASDWLAAHDRAVEQRALRDAADDIQHERSTCGYETCQRCANLRALETRLRDRATTLGEHP